MPQVLSGSAGPPFFAVKIESNPTDIMPKASRVFGHYEIGEQKRQSLLCCCPHVIALLKEPADVLNDVPTVFFTGVFGPTPLRKQHKHLDRQLVDFHRRINIEFNTPREKR
jgi:hypothetical protein